MRILLALENEVNAQFGSDFVGAAGTWKRCRKAQAAGATLAANTEVLGGQARLGGSFELRSQRQWRTTKVALGLVQQVHGGTVGGCSGRRRGACSQH